MLEMTTIAAISTPIGQGGIGIIRISGDKSLEIIKKVFKTTHNEYKANTIVYGKIIDNGEVLDEVLVSYFKAPNSFTGEDTIEINSHGGILVVQRILDLILKNGAILAEPGEFTKRAFLHGKLDLSQAEAVIDLINSKTKVENDTSIKQLEGELGNKIREVKNKVIDLLSDLEANIDYPEYDIEEISRNKIDVVLNEVLGELRVLSNSFEEGKIIKDGINVAIVGKPNVGKSSLLNRFLNEERAIVTDIAGTTRDTIEESIIHNGVLINFIDTAGIHNTTDVVESIGIHKSKNKIEEADYVLAIIDNASSIDKDDIDLLESLKDKNRMIIINKSDINSQINDIIYQYADSKDVMVVSAKTNTGVSEVLDSIISKYYNKEYEKKNNIIITNQRHKEAIDRTIQSFEKVIFSLNTDIPLDMVSIDIQNGLSYLCEIIGEKVTEDVINNIFKKFCLGK